MATITKIKLYDRLTEHLGGEASLDDTTQSERDDAIDEAYTRTSERFELYTKPITFGQPNTDAMLSDDALPADFISYTGRSGYYNATPPALTTDTDKPWGGKYPLASLAISYFAAMKCWENKGPELYERAQYWNQKYNELAARIEDSLKARERTGLDAVVTDQFSFGGVLQVVAYNLDQTDLTPADRHRMFPMDIIRKAVNRAYLDISEQFELNRKSLSIIITYPVNPVIAPVEGYLLPSDFSSPATAVVLLGGSMITQIPGDSLLEGVNDYRGYRNITPGYQIITVQGVSKLYVTLSDYHLLPQTLTMLYNAETPVLTAAGDLFWQGMNQVAVKLITLKAMRDLMYGSQKTYNLSRFWQNEFDREVVEVKKILRRSSAGAQVVSWGYSRTSNESDSGFVSIRAGDSR